MTQLRLVPLLWLLRMDFFFMNKFRHGVLFAVSIIIITLMALMKISVIEFVIKKLLAVS